MKAARLHAFGSIDNLRLEELPIPEPSPNEVLVRVTACGINRADTELIKGGYGGIKSHDYGAQSLLPHTPGIEPVGVVAALGASVNDIPIHSRVAIHSHFSCGRCRFCQTGRDNFCDDMRVLGVQTPGLGGYAEYMTVPAENVLPLPKHLSFSTAAGICVQVGTAWWMMRYRADIRPFDTILIQGASGRRNGSYSDRAAIWRFSHCCYPSAGKGRAAAQPWCR